MAAILREEPGPSRQEAGDITQAVKARVKAQVQGGGGGSG